MNGGGNNRRGQTDVNTKGVNDCGTIMMGNGGDSAMDSSTAATGNSGSIEG
jgi:hypothetical protein